MMTVRAAVRARLPADPDVAPKPASLPSFRSVYESYFDFVWSSARRLGVPADAIDDVVQEVFIVVHARLHTVEQPASLRSWIYSVLRRTVSMYHRGRRTRAARESTAPSPGDRPDPMQPSPLDLAVLGDEMRHLWHLLGALDEVKREILVLAELEEMTVPEIAQATGVPLNTAYSRLRAARQEFNAAFARCAARQIGRTRHE